MEGNKKYEKIKDLNAGAFGFVYLARDKESGEKVAIKFMERGHKITKVGHIRPKYVLSFPIELQCSYFL